jgi:hypothetical protein
LPRSFGLRSLGGEGLPLALSKARGVHGTKWSALPRGCLRRVP